MWISSTLLLLIFCIVIGLNLTLSESGGQPKFEDDDTEIDDELHSKHVTLGILVDLHDGSSDKQDDEDMKNDSVPGVLCGSLNLQAFQQLAAVRWTTEFINVKSFPNEYGLDVVVHDTCGESGIALSETHQLMEWARENMDTPLIGVIVIGSRNNDRVIDKPLEILNKDNISAIVTSSRAAELLLSKHHNVFTTAPDISSVSEAIVALIRELESSSVAVLSSCSHAMKKFEKNASERSVPVKHFSIIEKDNMRIAETVLNFLKGEANSSKTVVLLLEPNELHRLLRDSEHLNEFQKIVNQKTWIVGTVGMNEQLLHDWSIKLKSKLFIVQPHVSPNLDFNMYFLENLKGALAAEPSDETQEYIERTYGCEWPMSDEEANASSCTNLTSADLLQKFHPDPDASFIVNAVSAYSAALRLAQLKTCKDGAECDHSQMAASVTESLRTLNFPLKVTEGTTEGPEAISTKPTIATEHELEGTRGRINHQGKLISRKYNILFSEPAQMISKVGQYSLETGLVMESSFTMPVEIPDTAHEVKAVVIDENAIVESVTGEIPISRGRSATKKALSHESYKTEKQRPRVQQQQLVMESEFVVEDRSSPEFYISRVWALVVVAIGITGVFMALYMLVYVLLKMCDGTLHGNQTLGIMLLLCVMILYSSVVLFVLPPGFFLCTLRVFLPSTALAFSFGILLLKAMQLRAQVTLGLGGSISTFNQYVTLAFIVAVQLAINLQWHIGSHELEDSLPPDWKNDCSQPHITYLLLHSYIALLILFVFLYGLSVIKIRRNFNEARWVTLTSLFSLPVIVGWVVVVLFGPPEFQEPASSISFLCFATIILFVIFVPKLGTISKQGSLTSKRKMLQQAGPGYTGSISTIFTTLGSDRGLGTLQSQKRGHTYYSTSSLPPPPPLNQHSHHHHLRSHSHSTSPNKCVTYSSRVPTTVFHSSSNASSMARSGSNMKSPFFTGGNGAYP